MGDDPVQKGRNSLALSYLPFLTNTGKILSPRPVLAAPTDYLRTRYPAGGSHLLVQDFQVEILGDERTETSNEIVLKGIGYEGPSSKLKCTPGKRTPLHPIDEYTCQDGFRVPPVLKCR